MKEAVIVVIVLIVAVVMNFFIGNAIRNKQDERDRLLDNKL